MNSQHVFEYLQGLQNRVVEAIQLLDGKPFLHDSWQRPEGGGGTVCILEQAMFSSAPGLASPVYLAASCHPPRLPPIPKLPGAAGRLWAFLWCFTRAIPTSPPYT